MVILYGWNVCCYCCCCYCYYYYYYWMERTLREIACAVGTPLILDNATLKRLFGHYARILVEIDFSKKIFHKILVEREGGSYPVVVVYERIFVRIVRHLDMMLQTVVGCTQSRKTCLRIKLQKGRRRYQPRNLSGPLLKRTPLV